MQRASWPCLLMLGCTGHAQPAVDEPRVEDESELVGQDPGPSDEVADAWIDRGPPEEVAKAHYAAGVEAFERGDYQLALEQFETAQVLSPHGALRYNLAVCLERLGRIPEAIVQLDALAEDTSQPTSVREQARERREALRAANSAPGAPDLAVAEGIVGRIVDLRHRHSRLRGLSLADVNQWEDGRGLDLSFARGVHYRDNPRCKPGIKCARLEDFDLDGVSIHLYLGLDPWQGAAAVPIRRIGDLHVVTFVRGPDTPPMKRLRDDIQAILDAAEVASPSP